jgi:large conductance mechanosensitive channel
MGKWWREFQSFALGGNVLDLALGFLIGAAFSTLVSSLANNILMQFVAAIFKQRDFSGFVWHLHGAEIRYGTFLTALLNFFMLAAVLFMVIKLMTVTRVTRNRLFEQRECPYCLELVPRPALVCKTCGQALVKDLPPVDEAERRITELRARRTLSLPPIPIPARRRSSATAGLGVATLTDDENDQQRKGGKPAEDDDQ